MAIFVVLIFQVLFILFAMSINVALVVHDKINLQNSLDLATYYGAKKQAEVLNAMAHINYQMRQNWKLLAWRYRILGTLGQDHGKRGNGSVCTPGSVQDAFWCPQNKNCNTGCEGFSTECREAQDSLQARGVDQRNYCDNKYFLCISNDLWKRGVRNKGVGFCQTENFNVPPLQPLGSPGGFFTLPEFSIVGNITEFARAEADSTCKMESSLNWLMSQIFLSHFRMDQRDRKTMIREIYNRSLKAGKDLDGKLIFEGAKKVFQHNLNLSNKRNFQANSNSLKAFNSFEGKAFQDVFEYLNTFPTLKYMDSENDGSAPGTGCSGAEIRPHYYYYKTGGGDWFEKAIEDLSANGSTNNTAHPLYGLMMSRRQDLEALFGLNSHLIYPEDPNQPLAGLTLSFVKKPEQVLYYALKVEFKPDSQHQIFSLNLNRELSFKASSFAKAFGGSFGPKLEQSDPLIPIRNQGVNYIPNQISYLLQPNYSRWPGDRWGLIAKKLHQTGDHFLKKFDTTTNRNYDFYYSMEDFLHLIFYETADDPLARPLKSYNSNEIHEMGFIRLMELMAVYPDLYDISYYSISANYMETYFPKICKLLRNGSDCQSGSSDRNRIAGLSFKAYIRGDFGWPEWRFYRNRNQQRGTTDLSIAPYFLKRTSQPYMDEGGIVTRLLGQTGNRPVRDLTSRRIFYEWLALNLPAELLSSWTPTQDPSRYENYLFPDQSFLKCQKEALKNKPVQSSCVVGGRSGYSVKLISCETVKALDDNLQPNDIREYCPS